MRKQILNVLKRYASGKRYAVRNVPAFIFHKTRL